MLGTTTFTDALVTVTLTSDTTGVFEAYPGTGVLANIGTATLSIDGVATATFNDPNGYAVFFFPFHPVPGEPPVPGSGSALFILQFDGSGYAGGTGILGLLDHPSLAAGYDLVSPLGLAGSGGGVATNPDGTPPPFSTDAGALRLTSGGDNATVTVTVNAVPEPGSLSLFAVGSLGAIAARRRRQRREL
jgi:hypothetical protein